MLQTIHEVDFCAQIASAVNVLIYQNPTAFFPFQEARIEGIGTGVARRKRGDLRFRDAKGAVILSGEVKLPGTDEGRSPYAGELVKDASLKADAAGVQYFFTWNVNTFVLWDRSLYDRPLLDRRIAEWPLARTFSSPEEVARDENLAFIKTEFLPNLIRDLAEIVTGRKRDWSMPADDIFIRSLNSHLDWPSQLLSAFIRERSSRDRRFDGQVQSWMGEQDWTIVRNDEKAWGKLVDNMAKTLSYIWANRIIFYKALRARFPDLPPLKLRSSITTPDQTVAAFNRLFQQAATRSGDYEPLLMPEAKDWATELAFHPENALIAWRGLLREIEPIDFRVVSSDVVGKIFQKLIGPEERHRYGQHFTGDDVVDLINVFCIKKGSDTVLDPACGSASFLVRAYYRKRFLDPRQSHQALIAELFGCDIALYPAHLAILNLAAREIQDEANYPRIARRNFFDFETDQSFCRIPQTDRPEVQVGIPLPKLQAVVGNPPYVRQEQVDKNDKARFRQIATKAWPGLQLSGRSDLHCYFWPAAARLLSNDGYFGFLTSSSWLDVEYGFALQEWILRHFRILAIMESAVEPWFEDARVKTAVTILQRSDDEKERMTNPVRFVQFNRKLADIIGIPPTPEHEEERQKALERLQARILKEGQGNPSEDLRIVVKSQQELWNDGIKAGRLVAAGVTVTESHGDEAEHHDEEIRPKTAIDWKRHGEAQSIVYRAGKWGRYLRAPDLYFEMMNRFKTRFVPLGEIAQVRRGITSGCDAFFMPKDVTRALLEAYEDDRQFRHNAGGAPRVEVARGKIKIIEDGNKVIHPIEAEYVAPEVHSLMKVERPVVRAIDVDRVVLLVGDPMEELRRKAPWVYRYLRNGRTGTFDSKRSGGKPVPQRSTCAARDPWYDLTGLVKPGIAFWPMAQQYRHIIPANPERLICNHNLFDLACDDLTTGEQKALIAILNSTLVGLFKTFYGRYAGTEGNLKTEVIDVNLLEIPDPRGITKDLADRLKCAVEQMNQRTVGRLVEEQLMACHSPKQAKRISDGPVALANELNTKDRRALDEGVFELLGVGDAKERAQLVDRLYESTAIHFRHIRVMEIEKMEQRSQSGKERFGVDDLAADIWDAVELEDDDTILDWLEEKVKSGTTVSIPYERPVRLSDNIMFAPKTVYFGKINPLTLNCSSRKQAELVTRLAMLGVTGDVTIPEVQTQCGELSRQVESRVNKAIVQFTELAQKRTGDQRVQTQVIEVLQRWFVLGKESECEAKPARPSNTTESDE